MRLMAVTVFIGQSTQISAFVGLSMKCYRLGKEKRTYLGERQFKGRIGK